MASKLFSTEDLERAVAERLPVARLRWSEEQADAENKRILAKAGLNEGWGEICFVQDYDNNRIDNQHNGKPTQTTLQHDQPNYSWQPEGLFIHNRELSELKEGLSNHNREISELKEGIAQLVKFQLNSSMQFTQFTTQLTQFTKQQVETNEAFKMKIGSITDAVKELVQIGKQQSKVDEVVITDLKELRSQFGKLSEVVNEWEYGDFPNNTVNPRYEEVKVIKSSPGCKEGARFPETLTSARRSVHERSYEHIPETEIFTSTREADHEHSYDNDELGFDTGNVTSARNIINERSDELQKEGLGAETFTSARKGDHERSYSRSEEEVYVQRFIPSPFSKKKSSVKNCCILSEVEHTSQPAIFADVFDEDPHLSVLFNEEKDEDDAEVHDYPKLVRERDKLLMEDLPLVEPKPPDLISVSEHVLYDFIDSTDTSPVFISADANEDKLVLEFVKPLVEEKKPMELKSLPLDPLRYEFLYQSNAFPVYLFAGLLGLEDAEPHVWKRRKKEIDEKRRIISLGVLKEEIILGDKGKPYEMPQRRFIDMKKEVDRKEIIK